MLRQWPCAEKRNGLIFSCQSGDPAKRARAIVQAVSDNGNFFYIPAVLFVSPR